MNDAAPAFRGRYLSITSYRRDGRSVATPVWFVQRDGKLLVQTDAGSPILDHLGRFQAAGHGGARLMSISAAAVGEPWRLRADAARNRQKLTLPFAYRREMS